MQIQNKAIINRRSLIDEKVLAMISFTKDVVNMRLVKNAGGGPAITDQSAALVRWSKRRPMGVE